MAKFLTQGSSILATDESLIDDNDSFQEMVKGIQNMSLDSPAKQPSVDLRLQHKSETVSMAGNKKSSRILKTAA